VRATIIKTARKDLTSCREAHIASRRTVGKKRSRQGLVKDAANRAPREKKNAEDLKEPESKKKEEVDPEEKANYQEGKSQKSIRREPGADGTGQLGSEKSSRARQKDALSLVLW